MLSEAEELELIEFERNERNLAENPRTPPARTPNGMRGCRDGSNAERTIFANFQHESPELMRLWGRAASSSVEATHFTPRLREMRQWVLRHRAVLSEPDLLRFQAFVMAETGDDVQRTIRRRDANRTFTDTVRAVPVPATPPLSRSQLRAIREAAVAAEREAAAAAEREAAARIERRRAEWAAEWEERAAEWAAFRAPSAYASLMATRAAARAEAAEAERGRLMAESIEERADAAGTANECPVCMDMPKTNVLVPCGHRLCRPCTLRIMARDPVCPVCRTHIDVQLSSETIQTIKDMPVFFRKIMF